jgi:hypothetical protein
MSGRARVLTLACGVVAALTTAPVLYAQSAPRVRAPARNAAYLEVLGNGGAASLNYERRLGDVSLRVGWGNWSNDTPDGSETARAYNVIPIMLQRVLYSGGHHLELGGGVLLGQEKIDSVFITTRSWTQSIANLEALVGYRRQSTGKAFVFRAGLTPSYALQGDYPDKGFHLGGGVSLGLAF